MRSMEVSVNIKERKQMQMADELGTEKKLENRKKFEDISSYISFFTSIALIAVIVLSAQQGFDLAISIFCGAYSFGALLYAGACINSSLGIKGSLELLKT